MAYIPEYRHCQFCREGDDAPNMLKYGVRHYAHTKCFRDAKGFDALMSLPKHVLDHATPMTLGVEEAIQFMDRFPKAGV